MIVSGTLSTSVANYWIPQNFGGEYVPSYDDLIRHRFHVVPSSIDVGNISSPVSTTVSVWNTHYFQKTLLGADVVGGEGITVGRNSAETTNTIPSTKQKLFDVNIGMDGAPSIDADVLFNFTGGSQALFRVNGMRMLMWGFAPDWTEAPTEIYEYLTDVFEAYDASEQRMRLRDDARIHVQYKYTVNAEERQSLYALQYALQAKTVGQPHWISTVTIPAPSIGTTDISLDTEALEVKVGDSLCFWQSPTVTDVRKISAITSTGVTLGTEIQTEFTAPVRVARMDNYTIQDTINVNAVTDDLSYMRPTFTKKIYAGKSEVEAVEPTIAYGVPVFDFKANRLENISYDWQRKVEHLDFNTGNFTKIDQSQIPQFNQSITVDLDGKAEINRFKQFVEYVGGRHKAFLVDTFNDDLTLTQSIQSGLNLLVAKDLPHSVKMLEDGQRNVLRVETHAGDVYLRKIDYFSTLNGDYYLYLTEYWDQTIEVSQIKRVSFMQYARFNADRFEYKYITNQYARINVTTRTVRNEL